ncbi:MAG: 4Fe-4S dicluster domain-containing protein [Halobacteriales archaeon]
MPEVNYGYKDGAGTWYITVDTDACDGCRDCLDVCPADLWELKEDEFAILEDSEMIAGIKEEHQQSVRYDCSPCKSPSGDGDGIAACAEVCHVDAIEFSW